MSGLRPVPEGATLQELSASDFTRNNRATAWVEAQRESLGGKGAQNIRGDGVTRVKNNSGDDLPRYSVLGIDGPLFDPLIYFDAFNQEVALIGSVPEAGTHSHKFVITQEPLVDLEVGRAWSDGIVPCKIDTASITPVGTGTGTGSGNPDATCANIMAGRTDRLQAGFTGFPIVWMSEDDDYETSTGTGVSSDAFRWAMIRMSSSCGGGDALTTEDNDCCAGCVCYPDANHIITECGPETGSGGGLACLYDRYRIIGSLPFTGETILVHDGGCTFVSDSFTPTICDVVYCSHHWELTVGAAPEASTLSLVCDGTGTGTGTGCLCLTLVYRNMWYFNPICGNRFGRVFACDDVPTTIAHLFPCEICIVAVGDVCPPCPAEGIILPCCDEPYPLTLTAILIAPICPQWDGTTATITFTGIILTDYYWEGPITPADPGDCTGPFTFHFVIIGGIACEYYMWMTDGVGTVIWGESSSGGMGEVPCPLGPMSNTSHGTNAPTCTHGFCSGVMTGTVS